MKPLISCLCITYARPYLLKELLYFFLAQDYPNKELIIVNDQKEITYTCNEPNVHVFNYKERFGSVGEKRNFAKAFAHPNSKYVFWLDDDDLYYPNFVSHLVIEHEKLENIDILRPDIVHFSTNNIISNEKCKNIGFPTACFTKEYSDNNDFEPLMFGSDQRYLKGARIHRLKDGIVGAHIRWGMGVYHVSGECSDIDNPDSQNKVYEGTGLRGKKMEKQNIKLKPELLDTTKLIYKNVDINE
jgi:glycosyltransferase involved in cell wall biosynthesis